MSGVQADSGDDDAPSKRVMRIRMASVAERLGLSYRDVGNACGISKTAAGNLMKFNRPPTRKYVGLWQAKVREGMQRLGATESELATLFEEDKAFEPPARHGWALTRQGQLFESEEPEVLTLKASLTPEAKRHFRLFTNPFDGPVSSEAQFFDSAEINFVREAAWQCAQVANMLAIVGESGAGKTTILEDLEERLVRDPRGVIVIKPSILGMEPTDRTGKTVKAADILHAIVAQLGGDRPVPVTTQARTLLAKNLLMSSAAAGNSHLLVIEEAHSLPDSTFRHLKRLHELRTGRRSLLGILLLAQPELKRRLADGLRDGTLREVSQRCEVVELLPLDQDLKAYLDCRARAVGAELSKIMDDAAVEQLRARLCRRIDARRTVSLAYPLAVHNLLTRAMNAAAEIGAPVVTAELVKSA